MAKFSVYRTSDGWLALNCQADTLDYLNTRLVVPLIPPEDAPLPAERLNPVFIIADERLVMVTQFAASLPVTELKTRVADLTAYEWEIGGALDMLISGY